ncbi:uncharacterized protein LOC108863629 [Galendromus occidentalis]|uniref:Poly [ADP-ribose] polymerase n=1 Tax=Galendromus occidentalis TaxID=34638 RepID=A0AAJ7WIC1_9ACAR|nr:uncharacterized protein LOC108863629 [Galendromus occidentalis]
MGALSKYKLTLRNARGPSARQDPKTETPPPAKTVENGSAEKGIEPEIPVAPKTTGEPSVIAKKTPRKKKVGKVTAEAPAAGAATTRAATPVVTASKSQPKPPAKAPEPREKRSRTATQPFQSSMIDQIQQVTAESTRGKKKKKESSSDAAAVVLYDPGEFLAVRSEGDGFFICRALEKITPSSGNIKIEWLDNVKQSSKNHYALDYCDIIDRETILTNLKLKRIGHLLYSLPDEERTRTMNILDRAIKVQKGELPPPDPKDVTADGLDVSLVTEAEAGTAKKIPAGKDEKPGPKAQKRGRKNQRKKSAKSKDDSLSEDGDDDFLEVLPAKVPKVKEPKPFPKGVIYLKGDFLAVRNASDGYYTCKVVTNIHQDSRTAHIQWMYEDPDCPNTYVLDYHDTIQTESILTKLAVTRRDRGRIQLTNAEKKRAEKALDESREKSRSGIENGIPHSKSNTSTRRNGTEPEKIKSESPAGMRLTIRRVNDDHSSSLLAADIPQMTEDPLWDHNNPEGGAISPTSDSTDRLFACVFQRDHVGLRRLLSSAQVVSPYMYQSVHVHKLALSYAVEAHDVASIRILLGRDCDIKTCKKQTNLMWCQGGERNKKEGNGALLRDYVLDSPLSKEAAISQVRGIALEKGVRIDVLEELLGKDAVSEANAIKALENGNYDLAVSIAAALRPTDSEKGSSLIRRILVTGGLEANDLFTEINSNQTTVFHLLMAMPNLDVLSNVLYSSRRVNMDQSIRDLLTKRDRLGRTPIHYAAAARTTSTLEWLIDRGANLYQVDNDGRNVLHMIAAHGRVESLTLLIKLSGIAHLDDSDRYGQSPLHRAILSCQPRMLERLLAFGADANKPLGSHSDRVTPLMLAAQRGNHLQMLISLLKFVDRVDGQDKRERSALIHAAMNGHTAAACLLLRHGANPHLADNSGNCALHHAAAYGHLFVVKLLVEIANLSPAQLNDAKMCSLEVAFRKGHIGLVKYMLGLGCFARGFDCGFGETLLTSCILMGDLLEPTQVARFEVLLKSCPQLALKTDSQGNNLFHRLVHMEHRIMLQQLHKNDDTLEEHHECLADIVDLVLALPVAEKALAAGNNEKETPVSTALSYGCIWFAARYGQASLSTFRSAFKSENALKKLAMHCASYSTTDLMCPLVDNKTDVESLKKISRSLLQKGINLLSVALQSAEDVQVPWKVDNVCSFIKFLFSALEHESSGPILHEAVRCRSSKFLETILESAGSGLNREARLKDLTALQEAAVRGNSDAVLLLLQNGAKTELMMPPRSADDVATPFFLFCCHPESPFGAEVIRAMVDKGTPDLLALHPATGDTALHYVVQKKNWSVDDRKATVELLLEKGLSASALNLRRQSPLHLAALNNTGCDPSIEFILKKANASIEAVDADNRLPLHYLFLSPSAEDDPIDVCKILVEGSMVPLLNTTADRADLQTVLHNIAAAGATLCCRYVLSLGVSTEVRNKQGNTAAALATLNERAGVLMSLIDRRSIVKEEICRAQPTETNIQSQLIWRYVYPKQTLLMRQALMQAVFEIGKKELDCDGHTEISDANERSPPCNGKREDESFINRSASLRGGDRAGGRHAESPWTSLIPGLLIDQLETVQLPITVAVDAAIRAENYEIALKLLTRIKDLWTLKLILSKQTLLHLAAQQKYSAGQMKVVQALLDKEVVPQALDEHGCCALTYANINWNHVLANFLLDKMGVESAARQGVDLSFRTPLSAIFWRLEKKPLPEPMIDIARRLIRAGADINVLSCYPVLNLEFPGTVCVSENVMHVTHSAAARISPLIMAVCKKNHATARFLLREGGANPNFVDGQQRNALMYAIKLNDLSMAKLLLNYDYDIREDRFNSVISGCLPSPEATLREDEEIKKYVKTSPVDLGHQDIYGWTIIHHVVAPLPEMTYASTRMLRLLATIKAPLTVPDRNSIVPLHLSAARGVESLTLALQKLISDGNPCPRIAYHGLPPIADDPVMRIVPLRDFNADCEAYEEQQRRKRSTDNGHGGSDRERGLGSIVDPFGLSEPQEWEIVSDVKTKTTYDVHLTKLDRHFIYSFSKLQLLTTLDRGRFVVVERSGRVGDVGTATRTSCSTESEAVQEFCRLFQLRTGAKFEDMSTLRPAPDVFRPVTVNRPSPARELKNNEPASAVIEVLSETRSSKLPKPTQDLLKTTIEGCSRVRSVPADDCLRQALSILEEMRQLSGEKKELEKNSRTEEQQLAGLMLRLAERSHQFHALLPPGEDTENEGGPIGLEQIEPLWSEAQIDAQLNRVTQYLDVQFSRKILRGALYAADEINPLDYVYRSSQCKMQIVPLGCLDMQTVLQYIHNSSEFARRLSGGGKLLGAHDQQDNCGFPQSGRHEQIIRNIYRLSRESEEVIMADGDVGNHWLLWHPVENASLLSVLCRGVQATHLGVGWPTQMKGIKFYDRFEHDTQSKKESDAGTNFELLCQVALGDQNGKPGKANGGNSVALKGRWGPDAADHVSWQSCLLPLGPTVFNGNSDAQERAFNEYVVYKPQQVCIRYLVEYEKTWKLRTTTD